MPYDREKRRRKKCGNRGMGRRYGNFIVKEYEPYAKFVFCKRKTFVVIRSATLNMVFFVVFFP